jgi:VanZ family protein
MKELQWRAWWLSAGALLLVVVVLLSVGPPPPLEVAPSLSDKVGHALAYAVLGLWFSGVLRPSRYLVLVLALVTMGAVLEGVQSGLPEREADPIDMLANFIGVLTGVGLGWLGAGEWCRWVEQRLHADH